MVVVSKTHVRSRSRRGKYQLLIIILSSLACQFEQSALHYGLACIFTTYIYTWFSPTYSPHSEFLLLQFFTIVLYQKVHKIRSRYKLIAVFLQVQCFWDGLHISMLVYLLCTHLKIPIGNENSFSLQKYAYFFLRLSIQEDWSHHPQFFLYCTNMYICLKVNLNAYGNFLLSTHSLGFT